MEDFKGRGISFNPYKTSDKHYFGSFFNLADNNLNAVFKEFKERVDNKNKDIKILDLLEKHFFDNMSIVDYEKKISILNEYLPITDFLDDELENDINIRVKNFKEDFICLIKAVEELRNYYTHFYHEPITFDDYQKRLIDIIDEVLLKTVLNVKKNYLKADKTKEILKDSLQDEIDKLSKIKIKELEKKKKDNPKFRFSRDQAQIRNSLFNDAFKGLIYDDKETTLSNRSKSKINNYDIHKIDDRDFEIPLSTSGLVFLLSFFLSKKEVEDLKSNIRGFKGKVVNNQNSLKYMATHRVYSILAFKGLKYRIKTETFSKETLMMQMIDELSKVPDCVYKNLDEKKRKDFIEDWNEYFKDNEENTENLENSLVAHPVIRKRYEDKFNYFAIRFLDEFADFPTLKFQVFMGYFTHDKRTKKIGSTNIKSEREVKEKINVFGKLSEVDNLKKDFFSKLSDDENTDWEFFPNPSYNFLIQADGSPANNIAIYLKLKNRKIIQEKNDIKSEVNKTPNRKTDKPSKKEIIKEILNENQDFHQGDPTAILSLNELPALLYELLVKGKSGKQIESIIKNKIESQFQAIQNPSKDNKGIPQSLFEDSNNSVNTKKLKTDLQNELCLLRKEQNTLQKNQDDAKNYEKLLKKHRFKPKDKRSELRKYVFYNSEKGEVATWLANDIKRFMPKTFKSDWKGYQHSELQRKLAFYDRKTKHDIKDLLTGCEFDSFLLDINACLEKDSFEDFYSKYLEIRIKTIGEILRQIDGFKNDTKALKAVFKNCFKFLKQQNYVNASAEIIKKRILAKPSFLPRGIFDDKPTMIKGKNPLTDKDDFAEWFVSYLEHNDYQKFYNLNNYPIKEFDFKKSATIKKQKIKDYCTLKMVNYLLKDVFGRNETDLQLSELFQTRQERIKLKKDAKQQMNKEVGDSSENIRNQIYIWNKDVSVSFFDGKVNIDKVKLKNIGKYRIYERDERVKTFIEYEDDKNWMMYLPYDWNNNYISKPINVIDLQIQDYEKIRSQKLLKEIQNLEQHIFENTNDKSVLLQNGNPNFKMYILNGLLKNIKDLDISSFKMLDEDKNFDRIDFKNVETCDELEQKSILLIGIRNKFAHNQLPNQYLYDLANKLVVKKENKTYAGYYLRVLKCIISDLLKYKN